MNDHGKIVGYFINSHHIERGFLYSNGHYTTLNDPLGTFGTVAAGINDHGQTAPSQRLRALTLSKPRISRL
jgi:probable HAF family extracellular repeat protein